MKAALYQEMRLIRSFEQALLDQFAAGALNGTTHTSIGQEHIAVGVIGAIDRERDIVFSNHRCHGHFLAYSGDVDGLLRELMGREGALNSGIGGSQHIQVRNFYTNGVQGGIVGNAVGAALMEKHRASGAVTVAFLGDGTFGEGLVYESLNIASIWRIPILFVVENNQYAQSTPTSTTTAGSFEGRFSAFDIPSERSQTRSPLDVRSLAVSAIERVRAGDGPHALIFDTYRLGPHSKSDDMRDPHELSHFWALDPLQAFAAAIPEALRSEIDAATAARVQCAIEDARAATPSAWRIGGQ